VAHDATLWCWGWRYVGFEASDFVLEPTQVGVDKDWAAVSAGQSHACALKNDASLWCWGDLPEFTVAPTQIDTSYKTIAAGWQHSCGVRTNGTLWCWGDNASGQLGLGSSGAAVMTPTQVGEGTGWIAVGAGETHTCAIDAQGILYCWGANDSMQLGLGMTTDPVFTPTPIASQDRFDLVDVGSGHSCAARRDGALVCWGNSYAGLDSVEPIGVPTQAPLVP
jgi:alpha-tubulin suppressor-like RCC1 family protein